MMWRTSIKMDDATKTSIAIKQIKLIIRINYIYQIFAFTIIMYNIHLLFYTIIKPIWALWFFRLSLPLNISLLLFAAWRNSLNKDALKYFIASRKIINCK